MRAIILAGGKSSRMKQDKAELKLGGIRLVEHVYSAIKIQVNEVFISAPQDYGLELTNIPDLEAGPKGPVSALYAAWMKFNKDCDTAGFFTVPVDAPCMPYDLCERLYGDKSAVAVTNDGMHQTFAWWRIDDLSHVFGRLDVNASISLRHIAKETQARHVHWVDEMLFYNINTPNDMSRYLTMLTPPL